MGGVGVSLRFCLLLGFDGLAKILTRVEETGVWPNTMHPNWRTLMWVFFFFFLAKSTVTHFTLSPTMPSFFSKFEPRDYVLHRSDGGHQSCWKRIWASADVCHNREGS